MPALTTLRPQSIAPDCWADLGGFAQLRTLTITWPGVFTATQQSALESSLHALPHLTDLFLWTPAHRRVDTPPLALCLPGLVSLGINGLRVPTLAFLEHSPLLDSLILANCGEMTADDTVSCLQSFALRLRALFLHQCVRLSAEQEAHLEPPSPLLSALTELTSESL